MMKKQLTLIALLFPVLFYGQLVSHHVSNFQDSRTGALGDLDGDGDLDVLLEDAGHLFWVENMDGRGTFDRTHFIGFGSGSLDHIADVDDDGDMDVIYAKRGLLLWYENVGGTGLEFQSRNATSISLLNRYSFNYLHDMDGDGDLDFLSDGIAWKENLGNFQFSEERIIYEVPENYSMTRDIIFIDWDNDNDQDLIINHTVSDTENQICLILNEANGVFSAPQILVPTFIGDRLAFTEVADVDNDGDFDIAVHNGPSDIGWFRNENGSFSDWIFIYDYLDFPAGFDLVDVNRDGLLDAIWCGHGGVSWKVNKGGFSFDEEVLTLGPNEANKATNHILFGDLNSDSALDLVAMGRAISGFPQKVRWYENRYEKTTAVLQNELDFSVRIYPNPVASSLHLEGEFEAFQLYDANGRVVDVNGKSPIEVGHLPKGLYFLNLQFANQKRQSRKVLIK